VPNAPSLGEAVVPPAAVAVSSMDLLDFDTPAGDSGLLGSSQPIPQQERPMDMLDIGSSDPPPVQQYQLPVSQVNEPAGLFGSLEVKTSGVPSSEPSLLATMEAQSQPAADGGLFAGMSFSGASTPQQPPNMQAPQTGLPGLFAGLQSTGSPNNGGMQPGAGQNMFSGMQFHGQNVSPQEAPQAQQPCFSGQHNPPAMQQAMMGMPGMPPQGMPGMTPQGMQQMQQQMHPAMHQQQQMNGFPGMQLNGFFGQPGVPGMCAAGMPGMQPCQQQTQQFMQGGSGVGMGISGMAGMGMNNMGQTQPASGMFMGGQTSTGQGPSMGQGMWPGMGMSAPQMYNGAGVNQPFSACGSFGLSDSVSAQPNVQNVQKSNDTAFSFVADEMMGARGA